MVKYLTGETSKWGSKEKAANKQNISLKSRSVSALCFPAAGSEGLAASSSQIIPQACCKEHRLGPQWQVSVVVCVAPQEDIKDRSLPGGAWWAVVWHRLTWAGAFGRKRHIVIQCYTGLSTYIFLYLCIALGDNNTSLVRFRPPTSVLKSKNVI